MHRIVAVFTLFAVLFGFVMPDDAAAQNRGSRSGQRAASGQKARVQQKAPPRSARPAKSTANPGRQAATPAKSAIQAAKALVKPGKATAQPQAAPSAQPQAAPSAQPQAAPSARRSAIDRVRSGAVGKTKPPANGQTRSSAADRHGTRKRPDFRFQKPDSSFPGLPPDNNRLPLQQGALPLRPETLMKDGKLTLPPADKRQAIQNARKFLLEGQSGAHRGDRDHRDKGRHDRFDRRDRFDRHDRSDHFDRDRHHFHHGGKSHKHHHLFFGLHSSFSCFHCGLSWPQCRWVHYWVPVYWPYYSTYNYYWDHHGYDGWRDVYVDFHNYYDSGAAEPSAYTPSALMLDTAAESVAYLDKGAELFAEGSYIEALDSFRVAVLNDSDAGVPRFAYAAAAFAAGRYGDAADSILRGLELLPEWPEIGEDITLMYGENDDFDAHLEHLRAQATHHPEDGEALLVLGYVSYFAGDLYGAETSFKALAASQAASEKDDYRRAAELFLAQIEKVKAGLPAGDGSGYVEPAGGLQDQ